MAGGVLLGVIFVFSLLAQDIVQRRMSAAAEQVKVAVDAPSAGVAAAPAESFEERHNKLQKVAQKHNIRPDYVEKLKQLEGYEIIFLCDDSGSMTIPTGPGTTRWTYLQDIVNQVVDIALCFDEDGIDLRFLNRPGVSNVTRPEVVAEAFRPKPRGLAPMNAAIKSILEDKKALIAAGKKILIVLATDGEPTDATKKVNIPEFTATLKALPENFHLSIVGCTNDETTMYYLNGLDTVLRNCDVCNDYESEKAEILKAQGKDYVFGPGDYLCKILLGSIDDSFDNLDEVKGCGAACSVM